MTASIHDNRQHLLTIRNIVSTLFLAEMHYAIQSLETELFNLYEREDDKQAVSLFLHWFRQLALYDKAPPADYMELDSVYRTKEEVQSMLTATFEEERKRIYQAGREEGSEEGREEGREEVLRETILQLLAFRFDIDEARLAEFRQRLLKMRDQTVLTALLNCLLQKESQLENFVKLLDTALAQATTGSNP